MTNDWQSWAALGIVAVTAGLYVRHLLRRKRNAKRGGSSCDSGCDCGKDKAR